MARTKMTFEEWLARLEQTFSPQGTVSPEITSVLNTERKIGQEILSRHRGQILLMHCFQTFFIQTLNSAHNMDRNQPGSQYTMAIVHLSVLFRRFRACQILFESGYPLDAYALMRDVKDRSFMIGAIAKNKLTFDGMLGLKPGQQFNEHDARDNRVKVLNRIEQEFIGKSSGLSEDVQGRLKAWKELFHNETHNGLLTFSPEFVGVVKGKPLDIGPSTEIYDYAIFTNRAYEVDWMLLRLLLFLKPSENAFGKEWANKLQVLDNSFRHMVEVLGEDLSEPWGTAFIEMMDKRFHFKDSFCYFDSTYSNPGGSARA